MGLEQLVEESPIPRTILRTTQFYNLILMALRTLERLPLPEGFLGQPIDVGEVAERPVGLALSEPTGRVRDVGGPETRTLDDAVRLTSRSRAVGTGYCLSRSQAIMQAGSAVFEVVRRAYSQHLSSAGGWSGRLGRS